MSKKTILTIVLVIAIMLMIAIPSIIAVKQRHNERLLHATIAKITEAAKKCYLKEECSENKITLNELYQKDYIDLIANPITKEYYNQKSYVLIEENEINFIEIKD